MCQLNSVSVCYKVSVGLVQGCEWHWHFYEAPYGTSFLSDDSMLLLETSTNSLFTSPTRTRTRLCCLICVGSVNTISNKAKQFCLVLTQFSICNCSVSNILSTTENLENGKWIETRQNCLVLSVSAVWTSCKAHIPSRYLKSSLPSLRPRCSPVSPCEVSNQSLILTEAEPWWNANATICKCHQRSYHFACPRN